MEKEAATTSVTIGVSVRDVDAARAWYERVLGKVADIEPDPGIVEFEVHPGSWLQLYIGDRTVFRIGVKDVEAARDRLVTMGIGVGPIERVEGVIAFVEFSDPTATTSASIRSWSDEVGAGSHTTIPPLTEGFG